VRIVNFAGVVFFLLSSSSLLGETFSKNCAILSAPSLQAKVACRRIKGEKISDLRPDKGGFVYLETGSCKGYVLSSCIASRPPIPVESVSKNSGAPERKAVPRSSYRVAHSTRGSASRRKIRLGLQANFDGPFGRAESSSTLSRGLGFGLGLTGRFPVGEKFSLSAGPSYRFLKLTRKLDGTGALSDPNPMSFTQSLHYLGATFLAGYTLEPRESFDLFEPEWWLEGGLEFLQPLSGTQTNSFGSEVKLSGDRVILFLMGASTDLNFSGFNLVGSLQFFYNISHPAAPTFFGLRVLVAGDLELG
jgi:hypothetical protein